MRYFTQTLTLAAIALVIQGCNKVGFSREAAISKSGNGYSWDISAWGACSVTCGGGTQSRTAVCRDQSNAIVADSFCGTKPATSQACNTQSCSGGVNKTKTVTVPKAKVDVVLIMDDSQSQSAINQKLQQKMAGFLTSLQTANVDWQACYTTTGLTGQYFGMPVPWPTNYDTATCGGSGPQVLTQNTPNLAQTVANAFHWIGCAQANSDERGIAALNMMMTHHQSAGCFRAGAALATIMVSDEDERSVGGNQALNPSQYMPLEQIDLPSYTINNFFNLFGAKPFVFNSIIVKDEACRAANSAASGSPSYIGTLYQQLSNLTGGSVGSVCDADYSQNMTLIKNRVIQTVPVVTLDCTPIGTPTISIAPAISTTSTVTGDKVSFNPALPEGTVVTVNYKCAN